MPSSTGLNDDAGDAEPHLAGAGDGLLDVLVAQDAGVAVLVETHCLHVEPRLRGGMKCASNSKHLGHA